MLGTTSKQNVTVGHDKQGAMLGITEQRKKDLKKVSERTGKKDNIF